MSLGKIILEDTPLEDPKYDQLGFACFAEELADTICKVSTDDCLVFALYGKWGAGKTSCLNFVFHFINQKPESERPIVVRFNPWWFSGQSELLKQFFREFLAVLRKEDRLKELTNQLADFFEIISEIPEPSGIVKGGKIFSRLLRKLNKEKDIWETRKKINELLKKQKQRILVIIDDIDRLPAEEIRSVFRVIKAVADFPKTIYLLAFDKDIVIRALEDLQKVSGEDYLEKIVQVPINLPNIDKTYLRKLFFEQLDKIFSDTPPELFDQVYWGNVFWDGIDHFLNNIRDVKRLTNGIKVTYPLVKGEVNFVDFVAIETIRIFLPDIYKLIRNNPDMFAGYSDWRSKNYDIKPFHNKWLESLPEEKRELIKKFMIRLFPKLEAVFGNIHYGNDLVSQWRKKLRICNPDIFPIYFRLMVPDGQISYDEMMTILALAGNSEAFGNKLLELSKQHRPDGSTRVSVFLERLQDFIEKEIPKEHIPQVLQALFNVGDDLLLPEDEGYGLFMLGNDIRIERIVFQLLRRFNTQEECFKALTEAFLKGCALYMIVNQIIELGREHGKYNGQIKSGEERLVDTQHLGELERIALNMIKEKAKDNDLLKKPKLPSILYRWRDWEGDKPVREWVSKAISSDEGLVDFLTGFLSRVYEQVMTDRVGRMEWNLDLESLKLFLDPDKIIDRCKNLIKLKPDWLIDKKKIAIETFVNEYELRANGKNPDLESGE